MSIIQSGLETLKELPSSLQGSIAFLPFFTALDLVHTWGRYQAIRYFEAPTMGLAVTQKMLMGLLQTAEFSLWNNFQPSEGTGWDAAMENFKNLPSNLVNSTPFILGYAAIDAAFEKLKQLTLDPQTPDSMKTMAMHQLINAVTDVVNLVYWNNYQPSVQNY